MLWQTFIVTKFLIHTASIHYILFQSIKMFNLKSFRASFDFTLHFFRKLAHFARHLTFQKFLAIQFQKNNLKKLCMEFKQSIFGQNSILQHSV